MRSSQHLSKPGLTATLHKSIQTTNKPTVNFKDNRQTTIAQRRLQHEINSSFKQIKQRQVKEKIGKYFSKRISSVFNKIPIQCQIEDPYQRRLFEQTGIPQLQQRLDPWDGDYVRILHDVEKNATTYDEAMDIIDYMLNTDIDGRRINGSRPINKDSKGKMTIPKIDCSMKHFANEFYRRHDLEFVKNWPMEAQQLAVTKSAIKHPLGKVFENLLKAGILNENLYNNGREFNVNLPNHIESNGRKFRLNVVGKLTRVNEIVPFDSILVFHINPQEAIGNDAEGYDHRPYATDQKRTTLYQRN